MQAVHSQCLQVRWMETAVTARTRRPLLQASIDMSGSSLLLYSTRHKMSICTPRCEQRYVRLLPV